jgi:predicted negative regulator of RcsB-dependent stress response
MTLFRSLTGASGPRGPLALVVPLLLLSACVTITPRTQKAGSSAAVIPDVPMQKWGIESCGAGSLSTVLQHYGDTTTMEKWDADLPKTRGGVMTIDMLIAARSRGFDAQLVTGTPQLVASELTAGRPVILMLEVVDTFGRKFDFFHYIVADGYDPVRNLVRTQWGDKQGRWTTFAKLEKAWSGGGHAAIVIKPRDPGAGQLRAAVALEEDGKVAEAIAAYREYLSQHPESAVAWTDLGNAQSRIGKRTEAEEAFRKALAVDGTSRDTLNNLAWLLYEEKRFDEAETLARKAVAQQGPDSYLVLDTLARVLAAKGSCDEALSTFRLAIDSVPASHADARGDLEKALAETQNSCRRS